MCYSDTRYFIICLSFLSYSTWYLEPIERQPLHRVYLVDPLSSVEIFFFGKPCFNSSLPLLHYRDTFQHLDFHFRPVILIAVVVLITNSGEFFNDIPPPSASHCTYRPVSETAVSNASITRRTSFLRLSTRTAPSSRA